MESRSWRGIQEEDVWTAADELLAEGQRPTIERVRQKIGRGSPNTVSPMLERWFATLGKRLRLAPDSNSRPGTEEIKVPLAVLQAAQVLWDRALEDATKTQIREVEALRVALDAREAAIDFRHGELAQKESALEQTRNGLEGALASARQALDATQTQLEEAVRSRQESDAWAKQLQQQREEAQAAWERQRLEFAAQQAAWGETARQTENLNIEREKRLLLEVDRERQTARQANTELLKERKLREEAEASAGEAKRSVASLRSETALSQAAQAHAQESVRTLQEHRDELQKRLASEEESHQSTRLLLATALAPKSRSKRSP